MRAVDLEGAGAPSEAEVASRVAYMRVPDFFDGARKSCDVIVGPGGSTLQRGTKRAG